MELAGHSGRDAAISIAAAQTPSFNELLDFLESLRRQGYDCGTEQYINTQNLLLTLAGRGQFPTDAKNLKTLLAPLICHSPKDQEQFYERFDEWLSRRGPFPSDGRPESTTEASDSAERWPGTHRWWLPRRAAYKVAAVLLVMGSLALLCYFIFPARSSHQVSGSVVDATSGLPIAGARILFADQEQRSDSKGGFVFDLPPSINGGLQSLTVEYAPYPTKTVEVNLDADTESLIITLGLPQPPTTGVAATPDQLQQSQASQFYQNNFLPIIFLICTLPLVVFCLWWLRRRRRQRKQMEKGQSAEGLKIENLLVKGLGDLLYRGSEFRHTIQELRRHRQTSSDELDINNTVDATVRNGGLPRLLFGSRKTSPEFLILVDRAGFDDQQARLQEELVRRLTEDGLYIDKYYFDRDPRVCYKNTQAPPRSLQELTVRHPEHYLVIFSDGAAFIHPLTGEPQRWLETLSLWPRRAILTPDAPGNWGYREWLLNNLQLNVLPATKEGLTALVDVIGTGTVKEIPIRDGARPYPQLLEDRPVRWLDRQPPGKAEIDELYSQLRKYLGPDTFEWLCACAVYPMLYWELTLYFGHVLISPPKTLDNRLLALVRLPWFRHGSMPDWLRLRLIDGMPLKREAHVRHAIQQLLITATENSASRIKLPYVFEEIKQVEVNQEKRKKLRDEIIKQPDNSPLRDYVFLRFLTRNKLAVVLPESLRRLLFPQGIYWLGLRTGVAFFIALMFSVAGARWAYAPLLSATSVTHPPPTPDVRTAQVTSSPSSPDASVDPNTNGNVNTSDTFDAPSNANRNTTVGGANAPSGTATPKSASADTTTEDERIMETVKRADTPGASASDRKAAAEAYIARGNLYRDAGSPILYKYAYADYKQALKYDPSNREAKEKMDEIGSIYQSMGRPLPTATPDPRISYTAVIGGIQGSPQVKREGESQLIPATVGMSLSSSDILVLSNEATKVTVICRDGAEREYNSRASMQIRVACATSTPPSTENIVLEFTMNRVSGSGGTTRQFPSVLVNVRTRGSDGKDVQGLQIWCVPKALINKSSYYRRFPTLSSPTSLELSEGDYVFWATQGANDTPISNRVSVQVRY